jgi:phage tail-like protein
VEIEGEKLLGVFRVDGLITFMLDDDGNRVHQPFQLVKMVQRDGNNPFNKWLRETIDTKIKPRRELAIVAIDDGVETRRWTIKGAWISKVSYSSFDTASSEMVEEIITVRYDELQETWSATANLE